MGYAIDWTADHTTTTGYDTHEEAAEAIRARYPEAEVGHAGDLTESGDRTLAWRTEAESVDDDGARAVAVIRQEEV